MSRNGYIAEKKRKQTAKAFGLDLESRLDT